MKKYILSTVFLLLCAHQFSFAQEKDEGDCKANGSVELKSQERKTLFNKEFLNALSGITSNYIGDYASIDFATNKASFVKTIIRDGSVFSFNVDGGTGDRTLRFINNNELNYNFNLGFQYHFIDRSKNICFNMDVEDLYLKRYQRKKMEADAAKKRESLAKGSNAKELQAQKEKLQNQLDKILHKINFIELSDSKASVDKYKIQVKKDSIHALLAEIKDYQDFIHGVNTVYKDRKDKKLENLKDCFTEECILERASIYNDIAVKAISPQRTQLEEELKRLQGIHDSYSIAANLSELIEEKSKIRTQIEAVEKEMEKKKKEAQLLQSAESTALEKKLRKHDETAINTFGGKFNWFSVGLNLGLRSFTLYDANLALEEQLNFKENYNVEFTLKYSWLRYNSLSRWKSYLINTGATVTYGDNLNTLQGLTLVNETIVSETNNLTTSTKSETNVFSGNYKKDLIGLSMYTDIYYYLIKNNSIALHLLPEAHFNQNEKPIFSTQIGLVFSYKDADKPGAIVNAELFYSFNDIGNQQNQDTNFLQRNTIGLQLSVPLQF